MTTVVIVKTDKEFKNVPILDLLMRVWDVRRLPPFRVVY
jgi:hypothetical protein